MKVDRHFLPSDVLIAPFICLASVVGFPVFLEIVISWRESLSNIGSKVPIIYGSMLSSRSTRSIAIPPFIWIRTYLPMYLPAYIRILRLVHISYTSITTRQPWKFQIW